MPSPSETVSIIKKQMSLKSIGPIGTLADDWLISLYDPFDRIPGTSVAAGTDPNFLISGTGTETSVFSTTGGGLLLGTSASANDSVALFPDTSSQWGVSRLANLSREHWLSTIIEPGASIANTAFLFGFKLTETSGTASPYKTDADQLLFVYDSAGIDIDPATGQADIAASQPNLYAVYSIAGSDYAIDTGYKVVAGQDVKLCIRIDLTGRGKFYVNDSLVHTTPILTASAAFKPCYASYTRTTTLKTHSIRWMKYLGR